MKWYRNVKHIVLNNLLASSIPLEKAQRTKQNSEFISGESLKQQFEDIKSTTSGKGSSTGSSIQHSRSLERIDVYPGNL
jgi:hypothetical protein